MAFANLKNKFKKLIQPDKQPPRRSMTLLETIAPGKLPAEEIKQFQANINQLINKYNFTENDDLKKSILQDIQQKIRDIEHKYPPRYLAQSPGFQDAQAKLFKDIKYQFESFGIKSVRDETQERSSLPEIIANMSPEKSDALLKILSKGSNTKLTKELGNLYDREDKSQEAKNFRAFLKNHELSFLGGGNSKNFKVTNIYTQKISVLKVDNRLSMPRNVEDHLRNQDALKDKFTPIEAERQVATEINGETISRTLLVTEFCNEGSVFDHGYKVETVGELADKAGKIFEQMAGSMLDIQQAGCVFPDAKLTNWLVDENENIRIADTKSFLFVDNSGNYSKSVPGNEYCGFLGTRSFNPPEFSWLSCEADSTHAFILGKNLYCYLTQTSGISKNDASDFDFSNPVFQTQKGEKYKELIEKMVKNYPEERMSVKDAKEELFLINNPQFKAVLEDLKSLKFGTNDPQMDAYIQQKQNEVQNATPKEKNKILGEMTNMVNALKADQASQELRQITENYRKNAGFFTMGMNAKASRIESAMAKVPLEDRTHLLSSDKTKEVMEALASHRYLGKRGNVYKNIQGGIDPDKAATTFKKFKERFNIQKEKLDSLKTPEENIKSSEENIAPRMK